MSLSLRQLHISTLLRVKHTSQTRGVSSLPLFSPRLQLRQTTCFSTPASRAYTRRPLSTASRSLKESSISLSVLAFGLILSLTGILVFEQYSFLGRHDKVEDQDQQTVHIASDVVPIVRVYPGMPADILPGRPGNLTAEQEAKLRELWLALMTLSGASPATASSVPPVDEPATSADGEKKKHRFGGLLGRKKQEDVEPAGTVEDKHGEMQEYRQALKDQTPEQLRESFWSFSKADDPDALLLRFLRARKWDVQKALVMMVSTVHWRGQVVHLDDELMRTGEGGAHKAEMSGTAREKTLGHDFLAQMRLGKSFIHGTDKDGRPLCFVRVRLHKQGEQCEESLERYTVFLIETARLLVRPPIDTAVIVFDMTDFSMANMDYGPVKFMIKCFEANYPESLGHVLVHKAPWIFQGIWKIIRGWLDPVVAAKIRFTKDVHELTEVIPISHIPKELGGEEDWDYSYPEPQGNEDAKMADTATRDRLQQERTAIMDQYEKLTLQWAKQGGQDLNRQRLTLAEQMRVNYWKLDPYIRARSMYDRTGVIKPGGVIDFYPKHAATHANDVD